MVAADANFTGDKLTGLVLDLGQLLKSDVKFSSASLRSSPWEAFFIRKRVRLIARMDIVGFGIRPMRLGVLKNARASLSIARHACIKLCNWKSSA